MSPPQESSTAQSAHSQKIAAFLDGPHEKKALPSPAEPEGFLPEHSGDILLTWEGPDHEHQPRDGQWYTVMGTLLAAIVGYAIFTNSVLMAIVFIVGGVTLYVSLTRPPVITTTMIAPEGVIVGHHVIPYRDVASFCLFYEPPHRYILNLRMKSGLVPHINIPIHQVDPEDVESALRHFLPYERHEPTLVDTIERLLHI